MAGHVILVMLAAFGVLCAMWAGLGWLLPSGRGCALVCYGYPDEGIRSRYRWLCALGLFSGPLIAVTEDTGLPQGCETEICRPEAMLVRLEWERNRFDGTGNGDPTGRHQRRGISEL